MNSMEIRRRFTDYFVERGHRLVPSSSLIPNDPTLLLTNAGMNQFKPYFLGEVLPEFTRATSVQKCARTGDIENVGLTSRHLTFFEMLGNFSFGDYFKAEAIAYAHELVTERFGLEPDRLWATVYLDDDKAVGYWQEVGIPLERIQRLGKEDNFWSMGVAGPCGPCSEIHYDRGPAYGTEGGPAVDPERYLEIWNLVFMQNIRDDDYNIVGELPKKNIDTGLGLERTAMVLQGVPNLFETDVYTPILHVVQDVAKRPYGRDHRTDVSIRVVTEHSRTASFLIADGVLPSNEGRGYVLRRLLRRAVRHARLLGVDDLALPAVTAQVVDTLGEAWPELVEQRSLITQVVASEEESFSRTLRQGSTLLDSAIATARERGGTVLDGETAFRLHDTYGFPLELTLEAAEEAGLSVDRDSFAVLMEDQRRRAKEARKQLAGAQRKVEAYRDLAARFGPTTFVGYERTDAEARILGLLHDGEELTAAAKGDQVELVLDRSPFYAEGGGQVGDTGTVRTVDGAVLEVTDTRPGLQGFHVHSARVASGKVRPGEEVLAEVDVPRREAVARSHSATHVLHAALRRVLGEHARQQGSLVDAGRLRFDFAHFSAVAPDELAEVESLVNRHLIEDPEVRVWHATQPEAVAAGAIAMFGEKYGEVVRIVDIGDFSRELCGGTHVGHGSQVGPVRILGESSIGSNLRRVEALTGFDALRYADLERRLLAEVTALLRAGRPEDAPEQLRRKLEQLAEAQRELERVKAAGLEARAAELAGRAGGGAGPFYVVEQVGEANADELRRMATAVRDRLAGRPGAVVLGATTSGKAALVAVVTRDLADRGLAARDVLTPAARAVGGGAGGKGDLASAGGRDPSRLAEALAVAGAEARRRIEPLHAGGSGQALQ
ncbi:MAG TPA: alanine--tRNA ligase [Actinomycetes bacterium]|jgi:alanyl-tRNA synthetase|nr:alanine--tRNA ligase [Actinomycetes bacterium]